MICRCCFSYFLFFLFFSGEQLIISFKHKIICWFWFDDTTAYVHYNYLKICKPHQSVTFMLSFVEDRKRLASSIFLSQTILNLYHQNRYLLCDRSFLELFNISLFSFTIVVLVFVVILPTFKLVASICFRCKMVVCYWKLGLWRYQIICSCWKHRQKPFHLLGIM